MKPNVVKIKPITVLFSLQARHIDTIVEDIKKLLDKAFNTSKEDGITKLFDTRNPIEYDYNNDAVMLNIIPFLRDNIIKSLQITYPNTFKRSNTKQILREIIIFMLETEKLLDKEVYSGVLKDIRELLKWFLNNLQIVLEKDVETYYGTRCHKVIFGYSDSELDKRYAYELTVEPKEVKPEVTPGAYGKKIEVFMKHFQKRLKNNDVTLIDDILIHSSAINPSIFQKVYEIDLYRVVLDRMASAYDNNVNNLKKKWVIDGVNIRKIVLANKESITLALSFISRRKHLSDKINHIYTEVVKGLYNYIQDIKIDVNVGSNVTKVNISFFPDETYSFSYKNLILGRVK